MEKFSQRAQQVGAKVKTRVTQPSSWALSRQESSVAPPGIWSNTDYDPVPVERQIWTHKTILSYWFCDLISIVSWSQASAMYAVGLSATDATLACLVAGICISIPIVLNGRIGTKLHTPFPINIRASFGTYFHYFCVVSRAILALFWFGIHSVYGGDCMNAVLTAIWPSFANLPNHLPASADITTSGMIAYLLYHVVQLPFLFVPPQKLKYLFRAKMVVLPPVILGTVIWCAVNAGGGGQYFQKPAKIHGSARSWQWLAGMTSVTGGCSTLALNNSDWSRFAKKPSSQLWQFLALPLFQTAIGICGIVGASASEQIWGTAIWNPLDILAMWQGSSGGRAAACFCALGWLLAQISVNLSTNSVAFATDFGALAPKYLNIRRASFLGFLIGGWALCPWIILKSAETFLNFMSAYAVFMAPMTGILLTDYYIVKKQKYDVPALYNPRGIYYYRYGTNWRALVVMLFVVVPLLPAIGNKVNPSGVNIGTGLQHLYDFNWLYCFFSSCIAYYALNMAWPHPGTQIPSPIYGIATGDNESSADVAVEAGKKEQFS